MKNDGRKNPNPQGKGLVPVLAHWQESRPAGVRVKSDEELLLDLFTSTLVLSADFSFRPVPRQRYHLYLRDGIWRLSLIAPHEWGERDAGHCLGECRLREDMTWEIDTRDALEASPALRRAVGELLADFLCQLDTDDAMENRLPGYRADLPYYRRMFASGLSASLRGSMRLGGDAGRPARERLLAGGERLQRRLRA